MSKNPFASTSATIFLGGITALTAISIDILLPATGVIARDYQVDEAQGALLIGAYFLAFAVGQLFWGLFSDAYGRKRALMISLGAFSLASLACALAPSFEWLIALRAIQGLAGGAPMIGRAMVRDVATGAEAARILAVLNAVLTVATMIAPIFGSGLLLLFAWPAMFYGLALFGLAYLAFTLRAVPETIQTLRPERFALSFVLPSARRLFGQRAVAVPMLQGGLIFTGYASMLSTGAILTEKIYGVAPESFGALFAFAALSNTAGALLVRRLLATYPLLFVNRVALGTTALAALACAALLLFTPSLQIFWGAICLYVLAFGMVLPTSQALAMDPAGDMPGFAASLIGAVQIALGALGAALAAVMFDGTHKAIPELMAIFGFAAVVIGFFYRPAKS